MAKFSNTDSKTRPQKVAIHWQMMTPPDDSCGAPDTMCDGFWPSTDSNDCGYIGGPNEGESPADYQKRFKRSQRQAQGIMSSWKAGTWYYVGVVARAVIYIPIGGQSFRIMEIDSPGLWGIESSAKRYLKEVYQEQKAELLAELATLTEALASGDYIAEESE